MDVHWFSMGCHWSSLTYNIFCKLLKDLQLFFIDFQIVLIEFSLICMEFQRSLIVFHVFFSGFQLISVDLHWSALIFNWFSKIVMNFQWNCVDFHGLSMNFHRLPIDFHWFSLIFNEFPWTLKNQWFSEVFPIISAPFSPLAAGRRRHAHRLRWLPVGGSPLVDFFWQN